jgi:hypothetical protein
MKQTLQPWLPALFCAFLSVMALLVTPLDAGKPAFFAFLPMCFFFVGVATSQMRREIIALRKQVAELSNG